MYESSDSYKEEEPIYKGSYEIIGADKISTCL